MISKTVIHELLLLHKMAGTARSCMEEPSLRARRKWDVETTSYVEELEQIITSLNVKSIDILWEMSGAGDDKCS